MPFRPILSMCAVLVLAAGCARFRTLSSFGPEQIAARNSAFKRGLMPHESLWTGAEYDAYWDGHSQGYDDLYEPVSYSPTRYINEYPRSTHFFYRNGYSKGWAEAKAEAIADGEYRSRSSSTRSSKSRSKPPASSSAPKTDPAPPSSGSSGLIIPRRF